MRRASFHLAWACAALALLSAGARAQTAPPASISGRVTQDGKAAAGVAVMLTGADNSPRPALVGRATTDEEGRYTLTGVAAGQYRVMAFAPASIVSGLGGSWPPGRPVIVAAGETVDGIDFTLTRGGVITGRVTDGEGRPVVGQLVRVAPVELRFDGAVPPMRFGRPTTDDRGVYRIYGLMPGRYRVSAGEDPEQGAPPGVRRLFRRTFHPNAVEESEARIVEVSGGGEVTDVDISLGEPEKSYVVTGRVVDAETGRPLADVLLGVGPMMRGGQRLAGGFSVLRTDARGEFQSAPLLPGRYSAFLQPSPGAELYGEPVQFDVTDADVSDVVLNARRGASLSGVVTVEGTADRAVLARLRDLTVTVAYDQRDEGGSFGAPNSPVAADGTFRLAGLKPGRVRPYFYAYSRQSGFTLLRVERGGVEQPAGIEVAAGEQVTGVRLVVGYGAGVIRGRVRFEGEQQTPPDTRLFVQARRAGTPENTPTPGLFADVDARGQFVLEHLPPGEYVVILRVMPRGPRAGRPREMRQTVVVAATGETAVNFDLAAQQQEQQQ